MTIASLSSPTFPTANRLRRMQPSGTIAVSQAAERLRAAGVEVIDLGAGEPDFPTPDNIKQAGYQAIEHNQTRYTATAGTMALRRAIAAFLYGQSGAQYTPEQIMAETGGKQAIFNGIVTLLNSGDEVLIPAPYWVTFPEATYFADGVPKVIDTESTGFTLTIEQVVEAITPRTKLIILNSPSNPTGRVIAPEVFERVAELAIEHDFYVLTDDCYFRFVYPPHQPYTAAKLDARLRERILITGSFSKTYAMTGWRIGYAAGPQEWIKAMDMVQSHSTSNPNSISQVAAIEALTGPQESVQTMLAEYLRRRDWLIPALNQIPGISCTMPEGAFYAFPSVKELLAHSQAKTSMELTQLLLEEAHVAVTPGSAFGAEGYLRLSYANSLEAIKLAAEKIKDLAERLMK